MGAQEYYHAHQDAEGAEDDGLAVGGSPADEPGICGGDAVEHAVKLVDTPFATEEQCAEHRHQGKGGGGGNYHDDGNYPAELLEHHTGHSLDEGEGQEHAEHREGGGDDGDTHLGGAVYGSLGGLLSPFQMRCHIFQHHYGIVHHHTYGQRQRGHGNYVQGIARGEEIDQRSQQGYRDGQHDDEGSLPPREEDEHHQHDHREGDQNGLDEGVDGIHDLLGRVENLFNLYVGGQVLLDLLELLVDPAADIDGVGAGLFLDDDCRGALSVSVGFLLTLLAAVVQGCDIPQQDGLAAVVTHYHVQQFRRIGKLLLHAQGVGVRAYVDVAGREVAVFRRDDLGYARDAEVIGLELAGIAVNLDLAGRSTADADRTDALHTGQRSGQLLVEYLVQAGNRLDCRSGEHHNRHVLGAELEDYRSGGPVRQGGTHHVQLVADIVGSGLDVGSVFELEHQQRYVLLALGTEFLKVLDAVQAILEQLREVGLDIGCIRALVRAHHHNGIGVELREEGDGGVDQRIQTEYHEGDEDQGRRHRVLYCGFDYAHSMTSTFAPLLRELPPLTTTISPTSMPERISY